MEAEDNKQSERKTLDERNKMTELERIRHSCAHVMATAIAKLWPDAQFAAGPPVETGFYYDVELQHRITPEDFAAIEGEMKKVIKENQTFEKVVVSRDQALAGALCRGCCHQAVTRAWNRLSGSEAALARGWSRPPRRRCDPRGQRGAVAGRMGPVHRGPC